MPAVAEPYADPLQWRFEEPSGAQSEQRAGSWNNELCEVKLMAMHRPTHDTERMKANDYPFSWHLQGRKRLWELRLQMRFKETPKEPLFFAVELSRFVEISGITRQAQKALVSACQAIADCYHSNGDDPNTLLAGREAEAPTFAMPLWAFDQFDVSAPGSEPDLAGDLEGVGMRRTDNSTAYMHALKKALAELSTDRVYTFCFWGVSQFLDCIRWEVTGGILPGVTMDFNRLCGQPPVYFSVYALRQEGAEKRHLQSKKRTFFRIAAWSSLHPPAVEVSQQRPLTNADFSWDGYGSYDLLDLAAPSAAKPLAPEPAEAGSVDLLGLG
mmetsp:Transcript_28575/g.66203  ORF Transcript_28575/g.66203 Transcript_28575/m.66203 type:complete len:327 (-) Transcript_28575:36-1016(-)